MIPNIETISLRAATEVDKDAIAEVWHDSASLPTVGPAVMPSVCEFRRRIDIEIAAGWRVTVAAVKDEVIGFVAIKPDDAHLDQLFVRPRSIGSGAGKMLLAHAMAAMPAGFTLFTRSANTRARNFYERAGLIELRNDKHPSTGDPITYYRWTAA